MENYLIEEEIAKNGEETLKINGFYVHSKFSPSKEAERFAEENYEPDSLIILFGYGKGYVARELLKRMNPEQQIIIYDPILNIDLNFENMNVVSTIESLKVILNNLGTIIDKFKIFCSPNYDKINLLEYKMLLDEVKKILKVLEINENTIKIASDSWQENYVLNLKYVLNDYPIESLHKKFNSPVIVASGGPSLSKQLDLLKKVRNNVLIISAGSTINSLLKEGIEPDFIISIDGSPVNFNHFKNHQFKKANFVYLMSSYPKIREQFSTRGFFGFSHTEEKVENHFENIFGFKPTYLAGGGSVAHYALSLATYITSGPIALIGQDLAYTNLLTHAENNLQSKSVNSKDMLESGAFYTEGYYGEPILTDYVFYSMKETFEEMFRMEDFKEMVFNCTEGGVNLRGINNMAFDQFIAHFVSGNLIESLKLPSKDINLTADDLEKSLKEEIQIFNKIKKDAIDNISLINKNKSNQFFSKKTLKLLDENDKDIEKLLKKTCLGISMDAINLYILKYFKEKKNETPEESYTRVKNQSLALYRNILEATEKGKVLLNKALNERKEENYE